MTNLYLPQHPENVAPNPFRGCEIRIAKSTSTPTSTSSKTTLTTFFFSQLMSSLIKKYFFNFKISY